jgi:CHASE1-domain containing sensor protein
MTVENILIGVVCLIVGAVLGGVVTFLVVENNQKKAAALEASLTAKANAITTAIKNGETDVEKIKAILKQ